MDEFTLDVQIPFFFTFLCPDVNFDAAVQRAVTVKKSSFSSATIEILV